MKLLGVAIPLEPNAIEFKMMLKILYFLSIHCVSENFAVASISDGSFRFYELLNTAFLMPLDSDKSKILRRTPCGFYADVFDPSFL